MNNKVKVILSSVTFVNDSIKESWNPEFNRPVGCETNLTQFLDLFIFERLQEEIFKDVSFSLFLL